MNALQRRLNRLATEIDENEQRIYQADRRLAALGGSLAKLEARLARLKAQLNERNREAYIQGPGAPVLYLLTATSAAEAAARISLLSEMNRRDEVLADAVDQSAQRLSRARAEQLRLQLARQFAIRELDIQRAALHDRLRRSRHLFLRLQEQREAVLTVISRYRPFGVCPLGGPHAISDSFGVLHRHGSKREGGTHIHQGVDIATAMGTPILAPFDATAVASASRIGGRAVKVLGEWGYVYNAHLSAYGQLGAVQRGDVIGYAGATGNASGSHNHFEWHPGGGPAVDPYELLMKVC